MRLATGAVIAGAVLSALVTCTPAGPQAPTVTLRLSPTPATVGPTRILVDVVDSTGAALAGATVELVGRFEDAGIAGTDAAAVEADPGRYVVDGFDFPEAGRVVD